MKFALTRYWTLVEGDRVLSISKETCKFKQYGLSTWIPWGLVGIYSTAGVWSGDRGPREELYLPASVSRVCGGAGTHLWPGVLCRGTCSTTVRCYMGEYIWHRYIEWFFYLLTIDTFVYNHIFINLLTFIYMVIENAEFYCYILLLCL